VKFYGEKISFKAREEIGEEFVRRGKYKCYIIKGRCFIKCQYIRKNQTKHWYF